MNVKKKYGSTGGGKKDAACLQDHEQSEAVRRLSDPFAEERDAAEKRPCQMREIAHEKKEKTVKILVKIIKIY